MKANRAERNHGVARALSKLGHCSRSQAWNLVEAGRVRINGRVCSNPEMPVDVAHDKIEVDGRVIQAAARCYILLNKPRGLVTTRADEQGRKTVYACFQDTELARLSPVGRLDMASEGLLLFTNDTNWANRILSPSSQIEKCYHVQINRLADPDLLARLKIGVRASNGEHLQAKAVELLRSGQRNCWLKVVLDEGKNRHIRRLLEAMGIEVLRLVRVAIGPVELGTLGKGQYRELTREEIQALVEGESSSLPD